MARTGNQKENFIARVYIVIDMIVTRGQQFASGKKSRVFFGNYQARTVRPDIKAPVPEWNADKVWWLRGYTCS
jgi:hypothetical protein